jgi:hypothetical protein
MSLILLAGIAVLVLAASPATARKETSPGDQISTGLCQNDFCAGVGVGGGGIGVCLNTPGGNGIRIDHDSGLVVYYPLAGGYYHSGYGGYC